MALLTKFGGQGSRPRITIFTSLNRFVFALTQSRLLIGSCTIATCIHYTKAVFRFDLKKKKERKLNKKIVGKITVKYQIIGKFNVELERVFKIRFISLIVIFFSYL